MSKIRLKTEIIKYPLIRQLFNLGLLIGFEILWQKKLSSEQVTFVVHFLGNVFYRVITFTYIIKFLNLQCIVKIRLYLKSLTYYN